MTEWAGADVRHEIRPRAPPLKPAREDREAKEIEDESDEDRRRDPPSKADDEEARAASEATERRPLENTAAIAAELEGSGAFHGFA